MKRIFIIVLGVAVIVLMSVGVYAYMYQQKKIEDLESDKSSLNEDLEASEAIDTDTEDSEQTNLTSYTSKKGLSLTVTAPASGSMVVSPLTITGSVPGNWSHEAQFTVRLLGEDGGLLAEQPATLSGDWMTDKMVPFTAKLTFSKPDSATGKLVLVKANPSGMSENDDSVTISVQF